MVQLPVDNHGGQGEGREKVSTLGGGDRRYWHPGGHLHKASYNQTPLIFHLLRSVSKERQSKSSRHGGGDKDWSDARAQGIDDSSNVGALVTNTFERKSMIFIFDSAFHCFTLPSLCFSVPRQINGNDTVTSRCNGGHY